MLCRGLHLSADLCAVGGAVLDDPLELLVNELHAAHAGLLQALYLPLHQQLKRYFRHKKSRPWTLQCCSNPLLPEFNWFSTEWEKQDNLRSIGLAEEEAHRSVADGSEDVEVSQASQRVDRLQSAAKGFVEYVADPSTSAAAEEESLAGHHCCFSILRVTGVNCAQIKYRQKKKNPKGQYLVAVNQKTWNNCLVKR